MRFRLFLALLFIALIPLSFFLYTVSLSIADYYTNQMANDLSYHANILSVSISKAKYLVNESRRPLFDDEIIRKSETESFRILVVDSRGIVVNDSNRTDIGKTLVIPEIIDALNKKDVARMQKGNRNMYAAVSVLSENSEVIGAVLLVAPVEAINLFWVEVGGKFALIAAVLVFVIFVLSLLFANLIINPLGKILSSVRKITDGHLNERIAPTGSLEFVELSKAFNDMTGKLEQIETTRQEFVSNVSHELKTPLSSMKVLSDTLLLMNDAPIDMYREFMQDINSEVDRMTAIINELLALVKLDRSENPLVVQQVKINKTVEAILKRLYPLAEQKNIELLYQDVKSVVIDADEMKLSLAISNLVENAIKYTNPGGTVKVIVDADAQNLFITIQDNGIGIAEEDQSKIFTRFYRVDKTRDRDTGGTGLGLAITHKTVLLHNGSIRLVSKEGEGSSFIVRIPIHRVVKEI